MGSVFLLSVSFKFVLETDVDKEIMRANSEIEKVNHCSKMKIEQKLLKLKKLRGSARDLEI